MHNLSIAIALALGVAGCAAVPPNTVEIKIDSTPPAAVIYAPSGKMIGLTPLTLYYPLSPSDIAAGKVHGGIATALWNSGARATVNTDFLLDGRTSGTITFTVNRPTNAPGAAQDVEFAEARARRQSAESQAG